MIAASLDMASEFVEIEWVPLPNANRALVHCEQQSRGAVDGFPQTHVTRFTQSQIQPEKNS